MSNNPRVQISDEMKEKCYYFAAAIVLSENQYERLPNEDIIDRIERTFVGKLGEYVFWKYLKQHKRITDAKFNEEITKMLKIFAGKQNVDKFDAEAKDNKSVDVKTAYKPFHTRLVVNKEQFECKDKQKDFYVGIKLVLSKNTFKDLQEKLIDESFNAYPAKKIQFLVNNKVIDEQLRQKYPKAQFSIKYTKYSVLNIHAIQEAEICGYFTYEDFEKLRYTKDGTIIENGCLREDLLQYSNLSKAECKYIPLKKLNHINDLLNEF